MFRGQPSLRATGVQPQQRQSPEREDLEVEAKEAEQPTKSDKP